MAIVRDDMAEERVQNPEEEIVEQTLRPRNLKEFVGQSQLKKNLHIILGAAKKREESAPHLLFYGPPGLGKTTLAAIIAKEMNGNLQMTSGPAVEKAGDLAAILSNLQEGDILFLDEIHRLRRPVEEILYSAMEDFCLDLVVGKGSGARSMRLQLPKFTLVAATTRLGNLSSPLRDRFGESFRMDFYNAEELTKIITANAKKLEIGIEKDAAEILAKSSRGTPRIANRLLQRMRDFAHIDYLDYISKKLCEHALHELGVDALGLSEGDRRFLTTIATTFAGGPVGLSTLAAATSEEKETIEDIREPFLLQMGFLVRTPKGRMLSSAAFKHLGISTSKIYEQKQGMF